MEYNDTSRSLLALFPVAPFGVLTRLDQAVGRKTHSTTLPVAWAHPIWALASPYWDCQSFGSEGGVIFSRDRFPELFLVEEHTYVYGNQPERAAGTAQLGAAKVSIDTELDHPGGLWAAGNVVAVAVECTCCDIHANEVIFYEADGYDLTEVNRLVMDGSQGEPNQNRRDHASAVTFVRLRGGRYLTVVSGKFHEMFFYVSNTEELRPGTTWQYLGLWEPDCVETGDEIHPVASSCYGGVSGLAAFAQCDGTIFIAAMQGETDNAPGGIVRSWVSIMELEQDHVWGEIELVQRDYRYLWGENHIFGEGESMRWGSTLQVNDDGTITGLVTERDHDNYELDVHRVLDVGP